MQVCFSSIVKGRDYSRNALARIWGYKSFHAIARGVVTPLDHNKIIIFVTETKQDSSVQYSDSLIGDVLHWEGPTDHFAEERMLNAARAGDEIHLFYRRRHHTDFTYMGKLSVKEYSANSTKPSSFTFLIDELVPS